MSGALVLMCGLSFSGKSTIARAVAEALDARVVGLDDINEERGLWGGHGIAVEKWQRTHQIARSRTSGTLAQRGTVVVDDTSNMRVLRGGWRELAQSHEAVFVLVLVRASVEAVESRMNDAARTGARRSISREVFAEHVASFEYPETDERPLVAGPDRSLDDLILDLRARLMHCASRRPRFCSSASGDPHAWTLGQRHLCAIRVRVRAVPKTDQTAQQMYDDLMKGSFAPALRGVGFKGSSGRFELPSERYWAQLGFQKSAFSGSTDLTFTVNLSVIDRDVWVKQSAAKPHLGGKPKPSTFYGSWAEQVRIGRLTPSGEDLWWWLHRGDDPDPVGEQVVSVLLDLAVPWLTSKSGI